MNQDVQPGFMVKSKAGRDKGKHFMVYSTDGGEFVTLVDGVLRKQASPKKKRVKHMEPTGVELTNLSQKLREGTHLFDAEIRKALEEAGYGNKASSMKKEG